MDEDKIENFGMKISKKGLVFAFAEGLLKLPTIDVSHMRS